MHNGSKLSEAIAQLESPSTPSSAHSIEETGATAKDASKTVFDKHTPCPRFLDCFPRALEILAAFNIVPPLYTPTGDSYLEYELTGLFELGSLGIRALGRKHLIVAGQSGTGKTTTMLHLAAMAAICFPDILIVYWRSWNLVLPSAPAAAVAYAEGPEALRETWRELMLAYGETSVVAVRDHSGPVLLLADDFHARREACDMYEDWCSNIIAQLQSLGKDSTIIIAFSGLPHQLHSLFMDYTSKCQGGGTVDVSHNTCEIVHVLPPRDQASLVQYMSNHFRGYQQAYSIPQLLHLTGGNGSDIGRLVLGGTLPTCDDSLLTAVATHPGLRSLFMHFAEMCPSDSLAAVQSASDLTVPLPMVGLDLDAALTLIQRAGQPDAITFLRDMIAARRLYWNPHSHRIEPARAADIARVLRFVAPVKTLLLGKLM